MSVYVCVLVYTHTCTHTKASAQAGILINKHFSTNTASAVRAKKLYQITVPGVVGEMVNEEDLQKTEV